MPAWTTDNISAFPHTVDVGVLFLFRVIHSFFLLQILFITTEDYTRIGLQQESHLRLPCFLPYFHFLLLCLKDFLNHKCFSPFNFTLNSHKRFKLYSPSIYGFMYISCISYSSYWISVSTLYFCLCSINF